MSSQFIFNYETFYNYYMNPVNVTRDDADCVNLYFYNTKNGKIKPAVKSKDKCIYMKVNETKIYVSDANKLHKNEYTYAIHFFIPTQINGVLFDFHYHIGKRKEENYKAIKDKIYMSKKTTQNNTLRNTRSNEHNKSKRNTKTQQYDTLNDMFEDVELDVDNYHINPLEKLIYFHKTIQHPVILDGNFDEGLRGTFEHIECHFQDNTPIGDINNIVCIDKDEHTIGSLFGELDKQYINEIMTRPFRKSRGGRKTRHRRQRKRPLCKY